MRRITRRRRNLATLVFLLGFFAAAPAADAQVWYYVNGRPATLYEAQWMAARNLPPGSYWRQNNGNWGVAGDPDALGNVYGRRPSLSERGLLYSPGELLR